MALNSRGTLETQSQTSSNGNQVGSPRMENILWGRLYGKNLNIESLDLNTDEFSVGRGKANDLILTLNQLAGSNLKSISKVHFIIKRANCESTSPVYIQDLSRNGTFVNCEKIGLNKERILKNDDVISFSQSTHNAFVFEDLKPNLSMGLPEEITSTYHVNRKLGSGGFGLVHLVYDTRTCQQFAMKIVKKNMLSGGDPEQELNEAKIMKTLSHPCVVRMHDIVDKPIAVYMVLEFMPGGDLLDRIMSKKLLNEETAKLYFYQICQAVKYLHDRDIIHRDLKLGNVLLASHDTETLLKVCDFGLSMFVQNDLGPDRAPLDEVLEVQINGGQQIYTKKVDIWSLGVVLFCCLSGTFPFSDGDGSPVVEKIKKGEFAYLHPAWKSVSQGAKRLINQILTVDPEKRPSIDDVLQSSWLRDAQMMQKAEKIMKLEWMKYEDENYFYEPCTKRSRSY